MHNNKKSNYYYIILLRAVSIKWENNVPSVQVVQSCEQALGCTFMSGKRLVGEAGIVAPSLRQYLHYVCIVHVLSG